MLLIANKYTLLLCVLTLPITTFAGTVSGKVALIKGISNGNTVFQLYQSISPATTYQGQNCLVENLGRGPGTVFQLGIAAGAEKLYSQLLMAQASKKDIKIEYTHEPSNYCFVTSIYTYFE